MGTSKTKVNKWFIAYKKIDDDIFNLSNLTIIEPEPDTYNADPFLFKHGDKTYVFYEHYDYDKGCIAYRDLEYPAVENICLIRPYHISFPFLIEEDGEIYMVPETGSANCIEIYKAVEFPDEWERVKTLVPNVCAGDSVIYKKGGDYYLFTTVDGDHKPRIYRANSLLGEYNEIWSSEILNSRPAGNMFEVETPQKTVIYRPVQEGLKNYGRAVIIKEVSFMPYRERTVKVLEPNWHPNLIGCHTYNATDEYLVVDGKIKL